MMRANPVLRRTNRVGRRSSLWCLVLILVAATVARADDLPRRTKLPDEHAYQRTLREHLASLTAKDYEIDASQKFTLPAGPDDPEWQYRHWFLSLLNQPLIGSKRGAPAINAPARLFTLAEIETARGVLQPPIYSEPAAWLVGWDYPGNPHFQSRALKLRTFANLCVLLTMLDEQIERAPELGGNRFDTLAPSVLTLAWSYPAVKDVLPGDVQAAYETGLRKMGRRLLDSDPRGLQPHLVTVAPVALWHLSQTLGDAAFTKEVEALARRLWTDPAFFNKAGYYIDNGGIDLGYAGSANIFTTWAALDARWPFAKDALDRTYRLRAYLTLPEPDGRSFGPAHFNSRLGSDIPRDQWEWGTYRDEAASLATLEAVYLSRMPTADELAKAGAVRAQACQGQINENAYDPMRSVFIKNDEIISHPWKYRLWQSWSFPLAVNYASLYAPADAFARRKRLQDEQSPWLKSPWEREPTFVRSIEREFTMVKQAGYRAVIHSGSVGGPDENAAADTAKTTTNVTPNPFADFMGFGGGQLSAFWTADTGSVILGRRGGVSKTKNFDTLETWRQWPIHAVSGCNVEGTVFTSARIRQPDVSHEGNTVRVSGTLPARMLGQERSLAGKIDYVRTFEPEADAIAIQTTVTTDGKEPLAELYETIPVFLRESAQQADATPTRIEFHVGDAWQLATSEWHKGVTAVRLTRFKGAVEIVFPMPRRIKLSPEDWTDAYMSRAACRNLLVDLREADEPAAIRQAQVAYRIRPVRQ